MSSDSITISQSPDAGRLQGTQTVVAGASQSPVKAVRQDPERQTSTASGQPLPWRQAVRAAKQPAIEQVESAVSRISDFVQNFQRDLQFSIDAESERLVVKIVDSETKEVIRQIPSEETLRIAKNLESTESLIFREQA
jgi:flagellar protein FlaG